MVKFTAPQWQQFIGESIRNTERGHVVWESSTAGPANADAFEAKVGENTQLLIWGYRSGYSYEVTLSHRNDVGDIEDIFRATRHEKAMGVPLRELHRAAKKQISDRSREEDRQLTSRAVQLVIAAIQQGSSDLMPSDDELVDASIHFSEDEWWSVLKALLAATDAGILKWTEEPTEGCSGFTTDAQPFRLTIAKTDVVEGQRVDFEAAIELYLWDVDEPAEGFLTASKLPETQRGIVELWTALNRHTSEQKLAFDSIVANSVFTDILTELRSFREADPDASSSKGPVA